MFNLDFNILFEIAQLLLIQRSPKFFELDKAFLSVIKSHKSNQIAYRGRTYDLADENFYIRELGVAKDLVSRINTDQEILAFFIYRSLLCNEYTFLNMGDAIIRIINESTGRKSECRFELVQKMVIPPDNQNSAMFSVKISSENVSECVRVSKEKAPLEVLIIFEPYLSGLESAAARVGFILDNYTTERHICLSL